VTTLFIFAAWALDRKPNKGYSHDKNCPG